MARELISRSSRRNMGGRGLKQQYGTVLALAKLLLPTAPLAKVQGCK